MCLLSFGRLTSYRSSHHFLLAWAPSGSAYLSNWKIPEFAEAQAVLTVGELQDNHAPSCLDRLLLCAEDKYLMNWRVKFHAHSSHLKLLKFEMNFEL